MKKILRGAFAVGAVLALGSTPLAADAQPEVAGAKTTPVSAVIAAIAKRSGKKFIVDPRVRGDIQLLQDNSAALTYDDFLMVMQVHGFAAVTNGDYVRVVPDAAVRQMALPAADDNKHSLAEYVTSIVPVKNIPAAMLVPVLRPLLPQHGHLVALICTNDLLIVDTFGNIQRLEKLVRSLDRGEPYVPRKCLPGEPAHATDKSGEN